jgi:uncharacterized protein
MEYSVFAIIILCSLTQSLFGIGFVAFGTPLLLLYGYNADQIFCAAVPSAIGINLFQSLHAKWFDLKKFAPTMVLGCLLGSGVYFLIPGPKIRIYVAILLIVCATLRLLPQSMTKESSPILPYGKPIFFGIGFIHAVSYMGGPLLSAFFGHAKDTKEKTRLNVASHYGILLIAQSIGFLAIGLSSGRITEAWENEFIFFPLIAIAFFYGVGNRIFHLLPIKTFQNLFTILLFALGLLLLR